MVLYCVVRENPSCELTPPVMLVVEEVLVNLHTSHMQVSRHRSVNWLHPVGLLMGWSWVSGDLGG